MGSERTPKAGVNGEQPTSRRKRYERSGKPKHGMTPTKLRLLAYVAECGILSTAQVARIAGMNRPAVAPHVKDLFEMGLLDKIAVPYANLAPRGENGPNLAFGPGMDIFKASALGLQYLHRAEIISDELAARKLPDYGPRNALFLAHELLVRDVRVWLELCSRIHGGSVEVWFDGEAAHIPPARPDAWFQYRLPGGQTFVGLVEADRGTERGGQWEKKARDYTAMASSGSLAQTISDEYWRLVAVAPDELRRETIAETLADTPIAAVVYVALAEELLVGGMERVIWNNPPSDFLVPFVPDGYL